MANASITNRMAEKASPHSPQRRTTTTKYCFRFKMANNEINCLPIFYEFMFKMLESTQIVIDFQFEKLIEKGILTRKNRSPVHDVVDGPRTKMEKLWKKYKKKTKFERIFWKLSSTRIDTACHHSMTAQRIESMVTILPSIRR